MQINPTAEQFVPAHLKRKVPGEYLLTNKYFWFSPAYLPTNLPGKTLEVNERNRISRFCFPLFFFFPRSKEIFQEIYFSKKQFKAKSKVHPDSREILFGSPSSVVFWGKLPSVTMENLDLPKLELSSYTSRGKGGVQMAVAAQLLLKFMKPVGQIIYAAPYPPQGVTYNQRGWNSPPILTFIYKIIKC